MALGADGFRGIMSIVNPNGHPVDVIDDAFGIHRLAVDAALAAGTGLILHDGEFNVSGISASVKDDNVLVGAGVNGGGLLVSGAYNNGFFEVQRWIRVNAAGQLVTAPVSAVAPPNRASLDIETVTVVAAGTPVNGPNVAIPNGFCVAVTFRETQALAPIGYIATSAARAIVATTRTNLLKGSTRKYYITNVNLLWFDSDTAGAVFDINVET